MRLLVVDPPAARYYQGLFQLKSCAPQLKSHHQTSGLPSLHPSLPHQPSPGAQCSEPPVYLVWYTSTPVFLVWDTSMSSMLYQHYCHGAVY